ncbi:MAG TPA: PDZ domain-containing protein, partial [Aggregatilineales bacterium]|nr:PDZ domain-containing protein [Aggregatilineales bacterium]
GPLLDLNGRVIGVNTAILSDTRSGSGIGFAIPSNQVRRVVPYLMAEGRYVHSWLGISGASILPEMRQSMNLTNDVRGVMVASVSNNGPAARAGLAGATSAVTTPFGNLPLGGDIITAINGTPITQMSDLISFLETSTRPGDTVSMSVLRQGQLFNISVTLIERPQ